MKKNTGTRLSKKKRLELRRCHWCLAIIIIIPLMIFIGEYYYSHYGLFQEGKIDNKDLEKWSYDDGFIQGVKAFELKDESDHCWILLHGYTSSTVEMEELAKTLHNEFNDTVYVPLLSGHGQVPSLLLGKNADVWYEEVKALYSRASEHCEKINVVGSSFGGMLALKLAEEEDLGNIYVLSPYLYMHSGIISDETLIKLFGGVLNYLKKDKIGSINDPEGLKQQVGYMVMPFQPLDDSFDFIDVVIADLPKVTEPVLVQQSKNDHVVDPKSSLAVQDKISSTDKKMVWYERSDHVILMDYDRFSVMKEIIDFEKERR